MYPEGTDAEWFGIDAKGFIARFTTAGTGPFPKIVVTSKLPLFYDTNELNVICDAKMLVKLPRPDDFSDLSKRGIFGYDWKDVHRSKKNELKKYELISRPCVPILYENIRGFFNESAPVVFFESIEFQSSPSISAIADIDWVWQIPHVSRPPQGLSLGGSCHFNKHYRWPILDVLSH